MQDIYFRGRQPIPELLRVGLTTDHLAETLRLHPPEKLRGDVYLYVATPQGTRDVARLLPEEGYTYPVRRDIMQRAGTLAAYAEVQGADGMVWHSVPFTLVVAPLPGADKPLDAAQMTAMQQALTELRKLAARAEAAAERLEAGGAGGVTPEQYGAAGDGVADDHDALAAAAEAAVAAEKPLVLEKGKVYRIAQQWQLTDNLTIEGSGAVILTDIPGMTGPDRAAISIWGRSNDDYIKGITIRNLTIRAADNCTSNYMLQAARCRGLTLSHMVFDCEPNTQSRSCMDFYGAYEDMLVENCVFRQLSAAPEGGIWVRTWTNAVESRNVRFLNCDFLKAGGVYNPGSENALWPMELTEGAEVQPYSGVLAFNVASGDAKVETFATPGELAAALTAGKLHASAAKGYQITKFILYAHDDYVTLEDVLKYREGADVDIRFDAAGNPVNAGTSGKLVWSKGTDAEEPDTSAVLGKGKLGEMRL